MILGIIDPKTVIDDIAAWEINKQAVTKLSLGAKFTLGQFFDTLDDVEIDFLASAIDDISTGDEYASGEMYLFMLLIVAGDGWDDFNENDMSQDLFDRLFYFISIERMSRSGFCELDRSLLSIRTDPRVTNPVVTVNTELYELIQDQIEHAD